PTAGGGAGRGAMAGHGRMARRYCGRAGRGRRRGWSLPDRRQPFRRLLGVRRWRRGRLVAGDEDQHDDERAAHGSLLSEPGRAKPLRALVGARVGDDLPGARALAEDDVEMHFLVAPEGEEPRRRARAARRQTVAEGPLVADAEAVEADDLVA